MTRKRANQILRMLEDMHGDGYIKRASYGGRIEYEVYVEQRGEPYVVCTENDWEMFLTGGM